VILRCLPIIRSESCRRCRALCVRARPLFVVRDAGGSGRVTYATLAEKGRRTLRFGCYDDDFACRLARLENEIAPAVAGALPSDGIAILPILAEAIALGDDVHQRNVGGLLVLLRSLPNSIPRRVSSWRTIHSSSSISRWPLPNSCSMAGPESPAHRW